MISKLYEFLVGKFHILSSSVAVYNYAKKCMYILFRGENINDKEIKFDFMG